MNIRIVSYFENGTLYFVSDSPLVQCGLIIGVRYTNTSDEVVEKYLYMRKGKQYSYSYDGTPITDYQEDGSVFFVGCFTALNKAYDSGVGAVRCLDGKWVRKPRLKNVGTSFKITDETRDGFRDISYTVEFQEITSKYGVHQYFDDYASPIGTEIFTPAAGYFNFGSNMFENFNVGDNVCFWIEFGHRGDMGTASPSLSMEVRTGDEILIRSFNYNEIEIAGQGTDLTVNIGTAEILEHIKNTGIVVYVNSDEGEDWITFFEAYRLYDTSSTESLWSNEEGEKTYSGYVFVELESYKSGTPWVKAKKAQEVAGLLIGIMETGLPDGESNIGYYHIAVGQTEAVAINAMTLEWNKAASNLYSRFATLVRSLVYSDGELVGAMLANGTQVTLDSLWQTEMTRNAYCYGAEVSGVMKYDSYNFVGFVSNAQSILDNAVIIWSPDAEFDDAIDGVITDDSDDDTPVIAEIREERESSEMVLHLANDDADERNIFDKDSFSKVRTNVYPKTIDPDALFNYDKAAITGIYTLHAGDVLDVSCTQVGEADTVDRTEYVKALNVAKYKQGIYETLSMTFPYTATEDEDVVLSVLKYYPYVDLGVKITRADQTFSVVITEPGRRKKQLMEDDFIEISFDLKESVKFPVGTYVDDEVFGRFFVTEEQMPKVSDGAYHYTLKLEAWYRLWGNKKYMLTQYDDASMSYKRKEMTWTLTNNLANHALAVIHNLQAVGYVPVYSEQKIVRTFAKNYFVRYGSGIMSKYKMGVGCIFRSEETSGGLTPYVTMEIGSHSVGIYGRYFRRLASAKFFSARTENGYIDAATGEECSYSDLTTYSLEELLGGVTFGDTTYILKQTEVTGSRSDARTLLGMTWSDVELCVPLVSKEGTFYGQQVIVNGQLPAFIPNIQDGYRSIMVITTSYWRERVYPDPDYQHGNNGSGRAAVLFEDGMGLIKCWRYTSSGQGREQFYLLNKTTPGLLCFQGTADIDKVFIVGEAGEEGITIYNPSDGSGEYYTYEYIMENFASLPYLSNNVEYTDDDFGLRVMKLSDTIYANRDLVAAVQTAKNGYDEQIAFASEVTETGGNKELLTDEALAEQYLVIHDADIPKRTEALTIPISGTSILDGLKAIADAFECEYWAEFDDDYTKEYKPFKLHFGKCQHGREMIVSDTPYTDSEGQQKSNAQSIISNGDDTDKGNKIYVFGGTENMPFTYRRKIRAKVIAISDTLAGTSKTLTGRKYVKLKVDGVATEPEGLLSTAYFPKPVTGIMYYSTVNVQQVLKYAGKYVDETDVNNKIYRYYFCCKGESFNVVDGMYERYPYRAQDNTIPKFTFVNQYQTLSSAKVSFGTAYLTGGGYRFPIWVSAARNQTVTLTGNSATNLNSGYNTEGEFFLSGEITPCLMVVVETSSAIENEALFAQSIVSCSNVVNGDAKMLIHRYESVIYSYTKYAMVAMEWASDNEKEMLFGVLNPANEAYPAPYSADSKYWWLSVPDFPFVVNDYIDIVNATANTPLAYFVQDSDNPASLLQLGEDRLLLPTNTDPDDPNFWDSKDKPQFVCKNGYIVPYSMRYIDVGKKTIEKAVVFNNEYPKAKLLVKGITTALKNEYGDAGNSQYQRQWMQYTLTLKNPDGSDFTFAKEWISDEKLKIRFLVPEDMNEFLESGTISQETYAAMSKNCKLAGMTFEVEYDSTNDKYIIVRNEDFGAKLPNGMLFPCVGDPVVLINWNTAAITSTGIVDVAEKSLMKKGFEYAQALAEDNFTLDAEMMSDWMYDLGGKYQILVEKNDNMLVEMHDLILMVRRGYKTYAVPDVGQRICVKHPSLKNGEKHTRILGYELKLDKPYDTPRITVGESEAYSHIRQLEKNITKLS